MNRPPQGCGGGGIITAARLANVSPTQPEGIHRTKSRSGAPECLVSCAPACRPARARSLRSAGHARLGLLRWSPAGRGGLTRVSCSFSFGLLNRHEHTSDRVRNLLSSLARRFVQGEKKNSCRSGYTQKKRADIFLLYKGRSSGCPSLRMSRLIARAWTRRWLKYDDRLVAVAAVALKS
jgi:hypothetical protein